ncbi:MAG TPA: TonB-dependent receptor [Bryobacteraceae bacterium]|nr:TonB-dependent receptor [Bryobacteraceae bacterium]
MWQRTLTYFGCLLLALPIHLHAQALGSIVGLVTDPGQAVIPSATVTAVEKNTNFTRSTTTASDGVFSLPRLPVGTYTVSAEAQGFDKATTEVTLDVDQKREVNFTLVVKGVATQVEVQATAPTLNTTTGMIGGLVEGRQVANLPLNGRDITNLMLMQPGQIAENNSSFPFQTNTSGNGNRGVTGSSYLDGMDSSDNELGGGQFGNFNLDAIAEFRVLQNNYSAEYGRGSGTIVSVVSKTGTNSLHGSLFEFVRNDKFDARNFFAPKVAPFRRNEYGFGVGGPVWVPKVYNGKNKTFWFVQYAGFRQRLAVPIIFPVPTPDERKGLVTITPTSGAPYQLQVPVLPDVSTILNKYPLPNNPGGALGPRTFQSTSSQSINRDQWSGRLDQRISDKDSFFFRYSNATNVLPNQDLSEAIINPKFSNDLRSDWINSGFSETHLFSSNLINEVRISGMQSKEQTVPKVFDTTQVSFADGALQNYGTSGGGFSLVPFTLLYRDGLTWVKGRHTMNFGGEYRGVQSSYFGSSIGGPNGVYSFAAGSLLPVPISSVDGTHNFNPGDPSPSSLVSFMVGISQFYQRSVAYPGYGPPGGGFAPFSMRRFHWAGWFQDDFKMTRNLTINIGLRYEYNSVPTETGNRLAGIVDGVDFLSDKSLFRRMVLNPAPIYREDYKGFGPRLGFAWKALPKTVFRGGFAVFTNLPLSQTADQQGFNFPFSGTSAAPNLDFTAAPRPLTLPPIHDLKGNVVPSGGNSKTVPANDPIDLTPYPGLLTNVTTNNYHNGYTLSGNFTIERELPWNSILQAGYVFNNAVSLYGSQYPNGYAGAAPDIAVFTAVNPSLSEFQLTDNHAHSTYNALQVILRKAVPTAGLTFQLSYTYSKAIDNATTVYNGDGANSAVTQSNPMCWSCEKARASFDVPHRVVVNFSYQLPFDKASHLPKRLTQGWTLWGIASASSGFPFTVLTPFGSKRYGIDNYAGGTVRPDLVSTPTLKPSGQGPEEQFFSNEVLADNANMTQAVNNNQDFVGQFFAVALDSLNGSTVAAHPGNLGRNTFRNAGFSDWDLSIAKDTRLFERASLQFRAEFFNLLNQHAFGFPTRTLTSPGFGVSTYTQFDPREIQLGLRLIF